VTYTPPAISSVSMASQMLYNRDGQPTTLLRPDGDNVSYTYDSAGRLIAKNHSLRSLGYAYNSVGRLATMTTSDGENLSYVYMDKGALVRSVTWKGPVGGTAGQTVSYDYNNDFRVTKEVAANTRAEYTYDADGLIAQVLVKNDTTNATLTNGTLASDLRSEQRRGHRAQRDALHDVGGLGERHAQVQRLRRAGPLHRGDVCWA